jgi:hypothetical protein
MDDSSVELRASSVMLGEELYFSAQACRTAIAREAERLAWFPLASDDDVATVEGVPTIGGC